MSRGERIFGSILAWSGVAAVAVTLLLAREAGYLPSPFFWLAFCCACTVIFGFRESAE